MNTVSIDMQPFYSYAVLAETNGNGQDINFSAIGDGYQTCIPHAFNGDLVGTAAFDGSTNKVIGMPPFYNIYQDPDRANFFFKSYYKRLTEFLGMTEPLKRNGYEPVMVIHTSDFLGDSQKFRQAAKKEHCFPDVDFIPSDLALLCRWMATYPVNEAQYILPVVIGEQLTTMSLYQLQKKTGGTLEPEFKGQESFPVGFMTWLEEFGKIINTRIGRSGIEITTRLHDDMIDFLYRILYTNDKKCNWRGIYKKELIERICLPDDGIFGTQFFSFSGFVKWLDKTANELLIDAIPNIPSSMVIGGKGALFPFDRLDKITYIPAEKLPSPSDCIAQGGILWPLVKKLYPTLLKRIEVPSSQTGNNIHFKRILP